MNTLPSHDLNSDMYQPAKRAPRIVRPRGEKDEARSNRRAAPLHPRLRTILKQVAEQYQFIHPRNILRDRKGTKMQTDARADVAWLLRQHGWSFHEIGKALGRDHSTIVRMVQRAPIGKARKEQQQRMEQNAGLKYRATLADNDSTRERPLTVYANTLAEIERWAGEVLKTAPDGSGVNVFQTVEQHIKMIPKPRTEAI